MHKYNMKNNIAYSNKYTKYLFLINRHLSDLYMILVLKDPYSILNLNLLYKF